MATIALNLQILKDSTDAIKLAIIDNGGNVTGGLSSYADAINDLLTIDLSLLDIYGNSWNQTTANCYVVKKAGTYKFPLVYGNAISNGKTNSAAYLNNGGEYSHDFVNYKDNQIADPWISKDTGETIDSAELSIADTDGIITDISVNEDYVKFKVTSVPETGANGVISIKNSAGTIMWSWHIWVWPDDLTPVTITNKTGVDYHILPVNLATKKDASTSGKMYNWFYQWGRPTPMLPPMSYNSGKDATNYGVKTFTKSSACATTYGKAIKNPHTFYVSSGNSKYNWFGSSSYCNLWDANCTSTGNSDNTVVKTVYDPCPVGFKMPNGNTFTGFSKTNVVGTFNNGWKFKRNSNDTTGVFFPASGYRNHSRGAVAGVGPSGCVWLSSASSQDNACKLDFDSSHVYPQYGINRSNGHSVRPVQE